MAPARLLDILQILGRHGVEVAGHRFRCLKLDAVIESKEQANREKDRAVLPILRRTLQQKKAAEPV